MPHGESVCHVSSPRKPSCRHSRGPATSRTDSGTLWRSSSSPHSWPSPCMRWDLPEGASPASALAFAMGCPSSAHSRGHPREGHGAGPTPPCTDSPGLRARALCSREMGTGSDVSTSCSLSGQETQTRDPPPPPALPPCPLGREPQPPPTGQEPSLQPPRMARLREPHHRGQLSLNFNPHTPKRVRRPPPCALCA